MRVRAVLAALLVLAATPALAAPRFWGDLKPGKHAVGLRVDAAGELQITTWYPAGAAGAAPVTFGDYWRLADWEGLEGEKLRADVSTAITGEGGALDEAAVRQLLATPMFAVRDAAPATGRFPLVLWSVRYSTEVAQSVLSEFLASQGYVVAFARPKGAHRPLPMQLKTPEERLQALDAQVADLRATLAELRKRPNVSERELALATWSYAGEAATRLQMSDPEVDAVLSLSSATFHNAGPYQAPGWAEKIQPATVRASYVFLQEEKGTDGKTKPVPPLFDYTPGANYIVIFPRLRHGNFNALEGMVPAVLGSAKVPAWSLAGPDAKLGYEAIARAALHFLQVRFAGAKWESQDWMAGIPEGFMSVEKRGGARRGD